MTTDPKAMRPVDQPPVPRPPAPSLWVRLYLFAGTGVLVLYLLSGLFGWDFRSTEHASVPASVRTSPGGYRTFHFWHTGYHGGK